eukprot:gnl/Dysnectes_brevis/2095_a2429_2052.p1 GENE.gnl/Dysnectes_brevis/2095_a2429_2052~~gnl/Dysnectes_brevis/2095_a2429_2052.p1  ORF type:complete len:219 (-),score=66.65 gnl/Dysnectes_brevis/2095_a2429_2052:31-687(-)
MAQNTTGKILKFLKNKQRSLDRFLERETLSEEIRETKKELLSQVQHQISTISKASSLTKRAIKNTKRYKNVREVELKKIQRKIKVISKKLQELDETAAAHSALSVELGEWQDRELYVRSYPMHIRYHSLFPKSGPLPQERILTIIALIRNLTAARTDPSVMDKLTPDARVLVEAEAIKRTVRSQQAVTKARREGTQTTKPVEKKTDDAIDIDQDDFFQ